VNAQERPLSKEFDRVARVASRITGMTNTTYLASLFALCALATTAHAGTTEPVKLVVGSAVGLEGQNADSPLGLYFAPIDEKHATLGVALLHVGASVANDWLEPGIDLEHGTAAGLSSNAAFFVVRTRLVPHWRVHPMLVAGVGMIEEHGTAPGNDHTGARRAYHLGPGLEANVSSHWSISFEAQLMVADEDNFDYMKSDGSVAYYMAHGLLIDLSARLGTTYRF
jgi:hypothetical protein